MKKVLFLLFACLCLLGSGCTVTRQPAAGEPVYIYTTLDEELVRALGEKYSAAQKNASPAVLTEIRILREEKDLSGADLVLSDATTLKKMTAAGGFVSLRSEYADLLPGELKGPDDRWTGIFYDPAVLLINQSYARKVGQATLLHWQDLPRQTGARIVLENLSDSDSTRRFLAAMASRMGQNEFMDYFKKISPMIIQYARFPITPVRMAATGNADIALTRRSHVFRYLQNDFPAYILIPEEGTPIRLFGAGIRKESKKQDKALTFLNWMLQAPEARTVLLEKRSGYLPVLPEGASGKVVRSEVLWTNTFYKEERAVDVLADTWVRTFRIGSVREEEE